ncbi:MAG: pyrroline-5-carboxylate reductase [Thermodesulfobacteriaceae bacterium]|nr:pyrroline-5-carboxylate reductase [Thermodesulfobacteriaceae bacterium]MCX8041991.1 pyrroline-5-carboxylate reductase [Thermodesulfobacteriaceae bacterium]MDW8136459.1 pyrroline-5-carboxylate reductase [Thermodesulfobacterium sp.]
MKNSIGIIGGGQMAEALIKGFLEKNIFLKENILVSEPIKERREYLAQSYQVQITSSNLEVVEKRELLLLAVKPQVMASVLEEIKSKIESKHHLIITIAAGLSISFYEKRLPEKTRLIRVMPNTCALVHRSISAIAKGTFATEDDLSLVEKIFLAIGEVVRVEERYMDGVTALSGSGPAYVALFLEALIDGGVKVGLPRDLSEKLALTTLEGTVALIKASKKNPYEIKAMVTSPGGTTISALEIFYREGFPGIVISAINQAFERSKKLSQNLNS